MSQLDKSSSKDSLPSSIQEKNEKIIDSFEVVEDEDVIEYRSGGVGELIKKVTSTHQIELDASLAGSTVIVAEMVAPEAGNKINPSPFPGLDLVQELLAKDPHKKILLTSSFQREVFDKKEGGKYRALLTLPNVGFLSWQPDTEGNKVSIEQDNDIDKLSRIEMAGHFSKRVLATLKHDIGGSKFEDSPYNPVNDRERKMLEDALEKAQQYYPGLDTIERMLDYVYKVDLDIPEVMRGEKIEGVFVDVDGTLLLENKDGKGEKYKLREELLVLLKEYEEKGKQITIWTGGDVEEKRFYLEKLGITWPVVSKYDYAGAIAEIVIDDLDQNSFVTQSKIWPEKFINVKGI